MRFTGEDAKKLVKEQGKHIMIPYGYTDIFDSSFYYCVNIKSVTIPDSVTKIEMCAFWNCKNLKEIIIPDSVIIIERNAFRGCEKLVVCCSKNSNAYKYCIENNIKVKNLNKRYKEKKEKIYKSNAPNTANNFEPAKTQALQVNSIIAISSNSSITSISSISKEARELSDKIDAYCKEIINFVGSIRDASIYNELLGLEKVMRKIQSRITDDADATKLTDKTDQFLEYYMPTVIKILSSYKNIEKHNLTDTESIATKKHVSEVLPTIKKAFEKEFNNMFDNERLALYADVKGLEAMLTMDGFMDEDNMKK